MFSSLSSSSLSSSSSFHILIFGCIWKPTPLPIVFIYLSFPPNFKRTLTFIHSFTSFSLSLSLDLSFHLLSCSFVSLSLSSSLYTCRIPYHSTYNVRQQWSKSKQASICSTTIIITTTKQVQLNNRRERTKKIRFQTYILIYHKCP